MALDDRYGRWKGSGKVGAPLSKRRNGKYVSQEDMPAGLFGTEDKPQWWQSKEAGQLLFTGVLFVWAYSYTKLFD
jgi:hypothetical protein